MEATKIRPDVGRGGCNGENKRPVFFDVGFVLLDFCWRGIWLDTGGLLDVRCVPLFTVGLM